MIYDAPRSKPKPTRSEPPGLDGPNADPVARLLGVASGQLSAVIRMAEQDRGCMAILHQLSAVQGELNRVRRDLLTIHLEHCLDAPSPMDTKSILSDILVAVYGGSPEADGAHGETSGGGSR